MALEERDVKINLAKEKLKNFQKKKNAAANGKDGRLTIEGAHNFKEVIRPSSLNGSVADAISVGHPESLTESTNASIIDGSSRRSSFALVSEVVGTNGMKEHSPEQRLSSKNDHSELQNSVDELTRTNQFLKSQIDLERSSVEDRILREHQYLREQLNNHIQTIGLLVAEKSELQASLSQMETTAKKKAVEAETLNSKLTRLHEDMIDKERSITNTSVNVEQQQAQFDDLSSQLTWTKRKNDQMEKAMDQSQSQLLEANRKLELKEVDLRSSRQHNTELEDQLNTTRGVLTEHAKSAGQEANSGANVQHSLMNDKRRLEGKLQEYQLENSRLQSDMEKMVTRYQALLQQSSSMAVTTRPTETPSNEAFLDEIDQLNHTIAQLNDNLSTAQQAAERSRAQLTEQSQQSQLALQEREALQTKFKDQEKRLENVNRERQRSAEEVRQLQEAYQALSSTVTDQEALLKAVESDKVALSRAMSQNKELKERLQELTSQMKQADPLPTSAPATLEDAAITRREMQSMEMQTEPTSEPPPSPSSPAESPYLKGFGVKIRNLEDEVQMYKNRQIQGDSEVIYLKNALRIKEEEGRLLDLTERIGAYKNLEHKFVAAMKHNAELSEHIDQLEHVIMQLQGETETIGDYIALYQNQRNLQRQRDLQKNAQISSLQQHHQQLKDKVATLHGLLEKLMGPSEGSSIRYRNSDQEPSSGDVLDTSKEVASDASLSNGLVRFSSVTDGQEASTVASEEISVQDVIRQVLRDIEEYVSVEEAQLSMATLPSSPHSFHHYGQDTSTYPLQCSCCTGSLMVV